ncbi:MAG: membrane protein insertase YidC [Gammaproteobacteria bacterium]|nr:membrane protein insertase YidC [Gammaproteobacteria bacterium]MDH3428863.1 membrane protein insertase YidC [Gammaproteobacteria bacterium]MDH3432747.1 membrane protein insertase YidC [Gammaproteobacteria bacterium]
MDNQRLLVWALFGMMAWLTYQAWMQDYGQKPVAAPAATEAPATEAGTDVALPDLDAPAIDAPDVMPSVDAIGDEVVGQPQSSPAIRVETDVFRVDINTQGGTLQHAELLHYPVAKDRPDELVDLLSTDVGQLGLIQTGLRSVGDGPEANHRAGFSSSRQSYELNGADELLVPLSWTDGAGITVEKRYRFKRGSYKIVIEQEVTNRSDQAWRGAEYAQLQRRLFEQQRSMFDVDSYSFDGPIVYDGDKSAKLNRDDLEDDGPYAFAADQGWFGAIQHHFVSAVIPEPGTSQRYNVSIRGDVMTASGIGSAATVQSGEANTFTTTVFVGPKLQSQLEDIDPSLKLTVDYGWLTILSQPLFWLLSKAFGIFGNWGVAIISVTVLIKLLFYKLTESSGRSMAKMRNLQPRLKALQERYKDDRQQLSQAMMELYKREKVNPAAGCLPILIQMPFFLAFYWVLLESVEMRQAPFALWISDLSSRDPFFILPLIMGAAMFFQQKLNPQVGDPVQVKVMQIMPIIFTVFFAFFPSGLVLYWVTNTLLSIAQQWKINKVVEAEAKQKKGGKKSKSD